MYNMFMESVKENIKLNKTKWQWTKNWKHNYLNEKDKYKR